MRRRKRHSISTETWSAFNAWLAAYLMIQSTPKGIASRAVAQHVGAGPCSVGSTCKSCVRRLKPGLSGLVQGVGFSAVSSSDTRVAKLIQCCCKVGLGLNVSKEQTQTQTRQRPEQAGFEGRLSRLTTERGASCGRVECIKTIRS